MTDHIGASTSTTSSLSLTTLMTYILILLIAVVTCIVLLFLLFKKLLSRKNTKTPSIESPSQRAHFKTEETIRKEKTTEITIIPQKSSVTEYNVKKERLSVTSKDATNMTICEYGLSNAFNSEMDTEGEKSITIEDIENKDSIIVEVRE